MSSAQTIPKAPQKLTIAQYLAFERASLERHEYFDGEVRAMAGETLAHGIISANLVVIVGVQLNDSPCFVVTKDTKVRSGLGLLSSDSSAGMFSYPDVLVVCGEAEVLDEHRDVITNPTAIIEVLSPSTENFDRAEKFHRYQIWNPSLQDYLLVSQDKPQLEHFHREKADKWAYQLHSGLEAVVTIPSIQCSVKLAEVYRKVKTIEKIGETP